MCLQSSTYHSAARGLGVQTVHSRNRAEYGRRLLLGHSGFELLAGYTKTRIDDFRALTSESAMSQTEAKNCVADEPC